MSNHLPYIIGSYAIALVIMTGVAISSAQQMRKLKRQVEQLRQAREQQKQKETA